MGSFVFFLLALLSPWARPNAHGAEDPHSKRVIIAYSFDNRMLGYRELDTRLRSELQSGMAAPVEFYTENLDLVRFPEDSHQERLVTYFRSKYQGRRVDLIIPVTLPALEFFTRYGEKLFPQTPIVFSFIDRRRLQGLSLKPNVTGVTTEIEIAASLEAALQLQPGTRHVIVPVGTSRFEQAWNELLRAEFRRFQGRVQFTYLTNLSLHDLVRRVQSLPQHSIIYYLAFMRDGVGQFYDLEEPLSLICRSANAPVYSTFVGFLGRGIVGGYLHDVEESGTRAGQMGRRILAGEKPENMPIEIISPQRYMFDWRQLRRWNISEKNLPPGSVVLYRQPSTWELYKWHGIGAFCFILVEALLIIALLINRARRKRAEEDLAEQLRFEKLVSELSAEFVDMPPREVDKGIRDGLGQIGEFLGVDRVYLVEFTESETACRAVSFWTGDGTPATPPDFGKKLENPWFVRKMQAGESAAFSRIDEIPPEARELREYFLQHGVKAGVSIPVTLGDLQKGAFSFVTTRAERTWPEHLLKQLQVFAEICVDALKRKRAYEALQHSEALKSSILASLDTSIAVLDKQGTIVAVNEAWQQFGRKNGAKSPAPICAGADYLDVCRRAAREGVIEAQESLAGIQSVLDGSNDHFECEYACHSPSEQRWFLMSVNPLRSSDGGVVVTHKEVTERRQMMDRIRKASEEWQTTFDSIQDQVVLLDRDLRILRVNKAVVSFLKLPPEEIVGQHCYTLMHGTDAPGARTLSTKQREELELFDEKRKAWFLVTTHPIMDGQEEVLGAVHVVKDITERKLGEAAAREGEDRFRRMSDAAPVMVWISDLDRRCTYFNPHWLEFRGRTMAQELGDGWEEGIHRDDLRRCHDTYNEAFNAREQFHLEFRLRRFDGEYRWVLETGVPRVDAGGELAGFIGSCVDITDRKRAEEDLQNLSGRMIQAQEEERQRVARELHDDVSQRLALVAIDLEQLAQSPPASQSELAERIQAIWSETQEVASDIHRLSRQLHPSKLEDLGLVAAVRSHCQEVERRGGLKIALAFHDVPRSVPPDVALCLYRVVQESLRNIIKHSGAERAEVELSTDPKAIHLRVSDSGAGFDLETVRARGQGLGLVSMRERLRSVGGEISIYSKPAQGTRVEVSIPLRKSADQLLSHTAAA